MLVEALAGINEEAECDEATAAKRVAKMAERIAEDTVVEFGGPKERQRLWFRIIAMAMFQAAKVPT
jgi:hypothetical protein